ncbi:hypothetical protein [Gordonia sp. DT101]|uniref:hypothetical protein n=1 Tax=Gordonia sp. DT101 TaxID=3416545 RepID=UPI003CE8BCFA
MADDIAERVRKWVERAAPPLSWEEFVAGTPCRGCGQPWKDEEPWEGGWRGNLAGEKLERYDAEAARFSAQHPECGSEGHNKLEGSLTMHCRQCCPPPPLSPEQRRMVARVFRESREERMRREQVGKG